MSTLPKSRPGGTSKRGKRQGQQTLSVRDTGVGAAAVEGWGGREQSDPLPVTPWGLSPERGRQRRLLFPGTSLPAPSPTAARGSPGFIEPVRNAVGCVQPPCSCFRVLCPAAGVESLNCAFEEQEEAEQGSVNDTVFPLPHLAPEGARVRFRIAGMCWIHRGMCLVAEETQASSWIHRGMCPVAEETQASSRDRPTPPVPAPRQRGPKTEPPLVAIISADVGG